MPDAVSMWLEAAAKYPIPTKNQQLLWGRLVQCGRSAGATERDKRIGDRARDRLVAGNLRLVVPIARKFLRRINGTALGFEDLLQAGTLGLIKAVEKFDPERGYTLSTPAYWWISQSIRRSIEEAGQTIRAPLQAQEIVRRWRYRPQEQKTPEAFCQHWGLTQQKLQMELAHSSRATCRSLDAQLPGDEDGSVLMELVADPTIQLSTGAMELEQLLAQLRAALPAELELVARCTADKSQSALARELGLDRGTLAARLRGAKERLVAVAGIESLELLRAG